MLHRDTHARARARKHAHKWARFRTRGRVCDAWNVRICVCVCLTSQAPLWTPRRSLSSVWFCQDLNSTRCQTPSTSEPLCLSCNFHTASRACSPCVARICNRTAFSAFKCDCVCVGIVAWFLRVSVCVLHVQAWSIRAPY